MRCHLLYIILIIISCCSCAVSAQQKLHDQDKFHYTGIYQLITETLSVSGDVEVERISPDSIKFYLFVVRYGGIAETNGTFKVNHGRGTFHNTITGAKNCPITFTFNGDSLHLKQGGSNGACNFGFNASTTGYYKRTSSQKPSFSALKQEEYNRKHPEAHEKRMKRIAKEVDSFRKDMEKHPVTINKFPAKMSYLRKDSLNKLKDYYNTFLQQVFRNSR